MISSARVAARHTKGASCPEMATPKLLPQVGELLHQFERTFPLQHLHQAADGDFGRHTDKQMNVVTGDVTLDNLDARAHRKSGELTLELELRLHLSSLVCDTWLSTPDAGES